MPSDEERAISVDRLKKTLRMLSGARIMVRYRGQQFTGIVRGAAIDTLTCDLDLVEGQFQIPLPRSFARLKPSEGSVRAAWDADGQEVEVNIERPSFEPAKEHLLSDVRGAITHLLQEMDTDLEPLSLASGLDPRRLSGLLDGTLDMSVDEIAIICTALRISIRRLIEGPGAMAVH